MNANRLWHQPRPESGFVVDIHFYNSDEVCSIPCKTVRKANRMAMAACEEAVVPQVLGVSSVTVYRATPMSRKGRRA
jgi:hypothetical protein